MKNAAGINKEGLAVKVLDQQAAMEGTTQAGIGIITVLAAMVGVWGLACLVGGALELGVADMARGFIAAVTGR